MMELHRYKMSWWVGVEIRNLVNDDQDHEDPRTKYKLLSLYGETHHICRFHWVLSPPSFLGREGGRKERRKALPPSLPSFHLPSFPSLPPSLPSTLPLLHSPILSSLPSSLPPFLPPTLLSFFSCFLSFFLTTEQVLVDCMWVVLFQVTSCAFMY